MDPLFGTGLAREIQHLGFFPHRLFILVNLLTLILKNCFCSSRCCYRLACLFAFMMHFIIIKGASTEQFMFYKIPTQYLSKLSQTSWLQVKCQRYQDLRFRMFLCSNSSAVGLWLSRLRKKSKISFWTISHSPQFSVLKSYFGVRKAEQNALTLLHYVLGTPGPCVTQTMLRFCSFLCFELTKDKIRYVILGMTLPPLPQAELLKAKLHRCLHLISFLPCLLPDSCKYF